MQNDRYIRQRLLDEVGDKGQAKLSAAHITIIGCGGLGSVAAPYLAGAGIGKLTLIDGDRPDVSNLHRQVFFGESETSKSKAQLLADHILKLNSDVEVIVVDEMITKRNIESLIKGVSIILECTDNIQTKYLVNDFCHMHYIPLVYGAMHKYEGYVSFFENESKDAVHLRDIFANPNEDIPTCAEVGVMGTLAGIIGLMQANEAIKFIAGAGGTLRNQLLTYNILYNDQLKLKLKKSYKNNVAAIYQVSSYQSKSSCQKSEISNYDLMANRSDYHLVSILEDYEHKDMDQFVEHIPLSTIHPEELVEDIEGPTVFYCTTGKRSASLVRMMKAIDSNLEIYSLTGGLKILDSKSR